MTSIVKAVETYVLAAILVMLALSLYELFVRPIASVEDLGIGPRRLSFRGLDDLKDRLGNAVVLVLVVEFFQQALRLHVEQPVDLLPAPPINSAVASRSTSP